MEGPGTNTFTVVVTDYNPDAINTQQFSVTNTFDVVVQEVNVAPLLTLPVNTNIIELVPFSATATATDADLPANALTFALVSGPADLTVSPSGDIAWTPAEDQGPSTNVVIIRVTDLNPPAINATSLSVTSSFEIVVHEVNVAPVLPGQTNRVIDELTFLTVTNTATDADLPMNGLTYMLLEAPANAVIDANGIITWTPAEDQGPSTNTFTTVVTDTNAFVLADQQLSATNTFTVIVNEVNVAPVLTLPANTNINELVAFSASATASDSDLPPNALTFALVSGPAGLTVSSIGAIAWTPAEDQGPSTNIVTISVTDTNAQALNATSLSVTISFEIVVSEVNTAPVFTVPTDQVIYATAQLSLNAIATDADLPANTLTFGLVSGPSGLSVGAEGLITWTPGDALAGTTNAVTLSVVDNGTPSLGAAHTFTITVEPRPILSIRHADTNAVLSWPVAVTGFALEYTMHLGSGEWFTEPTAVVDTGTEHTVTVPASSDNRFYRLKR